MNAGTRVSAEIIVTTTTIAAARPSAPTKPTPEMYRPRTETDDGAAGHHDRGPGGARGAPHRGHHAHPGIQLLPVPGHQEQPVVHRHAEPEQGGDGRRGGRERDQPRRAAPSSASPDSTLKIADTSGIAAATSEPNMNSSSTSAQRQPDDLGLDVAGLLADLPRAGAVLHLQAGLGGRRHRVVQLVQVGGVQRVRVHVPADAGVRDRAVLGHRAGVGGSERADRLDHVRQLGHVADRLVDRRLLRRDRAASWRGTRSARRTRPAAGTSCSARSGRPRNRCRRSCSC